MCVEVEGVVLRWEGAEMEADLHSPDQSTISDPENKIVFPLIELCTIEVY